MLTACAPENSPQSLHARACTHASHAGLPYGLKYELHIMQNRNANTPAMGEADALVRWCVKGHDCTSTYFQTKLKRGDPDFLAQDALFKIRTVSSAENSIPDYKPSVQGIAGYTSPIRCASQTRRASGYMQLQLPSPVYRICQVPDIARALNVCQVRLPGMCGSWRARHPCEGHRAKLRALQALRH